mmetsp:Transcript_17284/g.30845  ORF Transcript_17284/g.30845 Transcript_17284/m.30845 type:complete len:210 (+) Transcript_17284:134-763(+)
MSTLSRLLMLNTSRQSGTHSMNPAWVETGTTLYVTIMAPRSPYAVNSFCRMTFINRMTVMMYWSTRKSSFLYKVVTPSFGEKCTDLDVVCGDSSPGLSGACPGTASSRSLQVNVSRMGLALLFMNRVFWTCSPVQHLLGAVGSTNGQSGVKYCSCRIRRSTLWTSSGSLSAYFCRPSSSCRKVLKPRTEVRLKSVCCHSRSSSLCFAPL